MEKIKNAKSNHTGILQMFRALYLNPEDCIACVWKRGESFDLGTASLIWFYSDLKLTKNSTKSIPLGGALPTSCARWCKHKISAKYPRYFLLVARSQLCCIGDWMSFGVEGVKQCMRCAEISFAGQGEPQLALLYKSHVQIKYVNFSTYIDVEPYT